MGIVAEIQIFTTTLNAPDNRKEIASNAQITGGNMTNFSAIEKRRIDLVFGISYTDNIETAKEALKKRKAEMGKDLCSVTLNNCSIS